MEQIIWLFISWFLHQTTTISTRCLTTWSCLSLDSYIKPQLEMLRGNCKTVVYLLIPTSNHNVRQSNAMTTSCLSLDSYIKPQLKEVKAFKVNGCLSLDSYIKPQRPPIKHHQDRVVYLLIPTSNHNCKRASIICHKVVYLLIPTSNHNCTALAYVVVALFISWFLHQTTTWS